MKKSIYRSIAVACLAIFATTSAHAQDPQYTQFYANQPMLNPAFTGAALGPRVSMNYRAQWVAIPGSFRQFAFGYDQPVYFGRSVNGLGILLNTDVAGEGRLAKTTALLNYSFAAQFGRRGHEQYVRFGLQAGIEQTSIDFLKLRFSDQIDQREGFIYATNEPTFGQNTRINPDVSAGLAYYNQFAWAGVTVNHLTQPNQQLTSFNIGGSGIDARLPMRITATAGVKIPAGPPNDPEKVTISPALLFMKQRNFNQLNLGAYVGIDPIIFGLWYRSNYNNFNGDFIQSDMIAGLLGFKEGIFSIGYSYDYTISRLTNGISGGSHEIAVIMEFERNKKVTFKHRKLPCPRF